MRPANAAFAAAVLVAGLAGVAHAEVPPGFEPQPGEQPAAAPPAVPAETAPDELARAADAAADAAAVIPPEQPAAAPEPVPASDDVDLASLGLDPSAGAAFDDKLNLYGFVDIGWGGFNSPLPDAVPSVRSFAVGNLNVYLAKNLTPRWRTLVEVRFMFAPNGSVNPDGTFMSSTVSDPSNLDRPISFGTISIERAYVEYDLHSRLTVRAGRWLTPYGIWNIDHGSPAIVGTIRPYIIGEQFFPEHQTGLDLFGTLPLGDYQLGYHATISNGRNPVESTRDPDKRPGLGGRLELATPWADTAKLGVSAYGGRSTGLVTTPGEMPAAYTEVAYGADALFIRGGLHLQAEVLTQRRRFLEGQRQPSAAGFFPDGNVAGAYVLAGHRFDRAWNVMPYAIYEGYKPFDQTYFGHVHSLAVGLNFRPSPSVVVKAAFARARFYNGGFLAGYTFDFYGVQSAWVF